MMPIRSEEEFFENFVLTMQVRRLDPHSPAYKRMIDASAAFLQMYSEDERAEMVARAERRLEGRRGVSPAPSPVYWPEVVWALHDRLAALPKTATVEDMVSTVLRAGWVPGK